MVVPMNNFGVYYMSDPPGYFRSIFKVTHPSHKPPFLVHYSHNQNRLDVYETLWAGEYRKGMGFGTAVKWTFGFTKQFAQNIGIK